MTDIRFAAFKILFNSLFPELQPLVHVALTR